MIDSRITSGLGGAGSGAATGFMVGGPYGAVIGGIAGGIGGLLSGGGEDDAKKLAEEQAKMIEMQAREQQRRKIRMKNTAVGEATARIYANNLTGTGSAGRYRDSMESEYRRQIAYDRYVAKKNAELTRESGQAAADAIGRAGVGSMIEGIGAIGSAYAGAPGKKPGPNKQGVMSTPAADFRAPASIG